MSEKIGQEPSGKPRCLFCGSMAGKRSREHVLRRAFKTKIAPAPALAFSHLSGSKLELSERPISQFDMTVNEVCRECNQGWLNELENRAEPVINELLANPSSGRSPTVEQIELLGYWAFVRSLLITYVSPRGRVPRSVFERTYRERKVPPGCYVQVGGSTHYVWEAGSHQSLRIDPGYHYLGFVGFGVGGLLFLSSISDSSEEASRRSLDVSRQPRLWYPGSFCWLAPPESPRFPLRLLSDVQAQMSRLSLALRMGIAKPLDQFGNELDPLQVVPLGFMRAFAGMIAMLRRTSGGVSGSS